MFVKERDDLIPQSTRLNRQHSATGAQLHRLKGQHINHTAVRSNGMASHGMLSARDRYRKLLALGSSEQFDQLLFSRLGAAGTCHTSCTRALFKRLASSTCSVATAVIEFWSCTAVATKCSAGTPSAMKMATTIESFNKRLRRRHFLMVFSSKACANRLSYSSKTKIKHTFLIYL